MAMVNVGPVRAKGCDFKIESIFDDDDHAELRPDRISVWKHFLDDVRRRIGCDVEIFGGKTANHVADATAREVGDVTSRAQFGTDLASALFHWTHRNQL